MSVTALSAYRYSSVGNCIVCLQKIQCRKQHCLFTDIPVPETTQIFQCRNLHCLFTNIPVSETTRCVYSYSSVGICIISLRIFQCRILHCLFTDILMSETALSVYRYSRVGNCIVCLQTVSYTHLTLPTKVNV